MRNLLQYPLQYDEVRQALDRATTALAKQQEGVCGSIDGVALHYLQGFIARNYGKIVDDLANIDQRSRNRG